MLFCLKGFWHCACLLCCSSSICTSLHGPTRFCLRRGPNKAWEWVTSTGTVETYCWAPNSAALLLSIQFSGNADLQLGLSRLGLLRWTEQKLSFQLSEWYSMPEPDFWVDALTAPELAAHLSSCTGAAHCMQDPERTDTPLASLEPDELAFPPASDLECPCLLGWMQPTWELDVACGVLQGSYSTGDLIEHRHPGLMSYDDMDRFCMTEAFSRDGAFRAASTLEGTVCIQDSNSLQVLHTWGDQVHGSRRPQMDLEEPQWIRRRFSCFCWSSDGCRLSYYVGDQIHLVLWM